MGVAFLPGDVDEESDDDVDENHGHDGGVNRRSRVFHFINRLEHVMFGHEEAKDRADE